MAVLVRISTVIITVVGTPDGIVEGVIANEVKLIQVDISSGVPFSIMVSQAIVDFSLFIKYPILVSPKKGSISRSGLRTSYVVLK